MIKFLKYVLPLIAGLSVLSTTLVEAQSPSFTEKFIGVLNSDSYWTSKSRIKNYSSDGNAKHFMLLGYYVNANNIMYESTKDPKYLKNTLDVINNIKRTGKSEGRSRYRWIARIKPNESNYSKNNKEFQLSEGYLIRYIAEYYYLVFKNRGQLDSKVFNVDIEFLRDSFFKWYNHSKKMYGDDSSLQSLRTHMGSHWATLAMYLYILDNNKANKAIYNNVFSKYNNSLKANMKLVDINGSKAFQWNSTWDKPFTNYLTNRRSSRKEQSVIQDVSHGNHVVQYILDSYKLGLNNWNLGDIKYLSNTLKYFVWDNNKMSFSENVDGTNVQITASPSGWKQSDGWMKLMQYDSELYNIYKKFYESNNSKIDRSSLNLQFYANFVKFESKH